MPAADTYVFDKYDIAVKDPVSGKLIGLMLTQNKDGTPVYQEYEDDYLVQQYPTGATYANVDPTKELPLVQNYFHSGMGQEVFDTTDPYRYYESINCDLRFKGMAIPGPTATGIALPSSITTGAATLANADFEAGTASWSGTTTASTTQARAGTAMYLASGTTCYQDAATFDTSWQGKTFSVGGWAYGASALLSITDGGGGAAFSNAQTAGESFEYLHVSHELVGTADKLRVHLKAGTASAAHFDDIDIGSPLVGQPKDFAEFNDELYIAIGGQLVKLHSGGSSFTHVFSFPATITDLEPFTDDYLYIACGTASNYWYCNTAQAMSEADLVAVNDFEFFQTVHTTADTMYGNDGVNTIRSTTDPLNGGTAWSGTATVVGAAYHNITDLVTKSGALYIMKEDMPYYLDSSGNVQNDLAPELSALTKSTSGKNAVIWLGGLFIPCGDQGLLEHNVDAENVWRSPADFCTNLATYNGRVAALAYDDRYLFAVIDDSTIVQVLAGRQETVAGDTSWVWHPISQITLNGCEKAFVSTVVDKRLWIASTDSSQSLYYIKLPTGYANITADSQRNFVDGGYFVTPYLHGNFRGHNKAFTKITLTTEDASSTVYWEGHYQKLASTVWVDIGDFQASPTTSKYIPANSASVNPISPMMRFKFVSKTASTASACKLLGYDVRAILYPDVRNIIACTVRCAQEITLKDGSVDEGMYTTIKDAIINARNATWPVEIRDIDGTTKYAKFLPVKPRSTVIKDEKGKVQERHYHLLMQEVTLS